MRPAGRLDNVQDIYELTPILQGLLFHSLYEPDSGVYIEQVLCDIRGDLAEELLRQAFGIVVDRHPALRSAFHWQEFKKPLQVVMKHVDVPWQTRDWRHLTEAQQQDQMAIWLDTDRALPIQLDQPPVFRCALLRLSAEQYRLAWTYHHLLMDGWSLAIVLRQLFTSYEALLTGQRPALLQTPPFRDYVLWRQRQSGAEAPGFWRNYLMGISEPTRITSGLPTTNPLGRQLTACDALNSETTRRLDDVARRHRVTVNTVVAGAVAVVLAHRSGRADVLFGSTVSGRPAELPGSEDMVGVFINALPLRARIDTESELGVWLQEMQARQLERDLYSQDSLVDIHGWSEVPRGGTLFELLLVYENYPAPDRFGGSRLVVSDVRALGQTNYPLTLVVTPGDQLAILAAWYDTRCESEHVRELMEHLIEVLEAIGLPDCHRVSDLPRHAATPLTSYREPPPQPDLRKSGRSRLPITPIERDLAEIWCDVLGIDRVGIDDNFFDLGGHSLNATLVISRIHQRLGVDVALRELFDLPTVGELAQAVQARHAVPTAQPPDVTPLPRNGSRAGTQRGTERLQR